MEARRQKVKMLWQLVSDIKVLRSRVLLLRSTLRSHLLLEIRLEQSCFEALIDFTFIGFFQNRKRRDGVYLNKKIYLKAVLCEELAHKS